MKQQVTFEVTNLSYKRELDEVAEHLGIGELLYSLQETVDSIFCAIFDSTYVVLNTAKDSIISVLVD